MKIRKDLTGQAVGVFRIKSFVGRSEDGHALWTTDCPGCGAEFSARAKNSGRIVPRGRRSIILPSEAWEECCAIFYREVNTGDAVGFYQALYADMGERPSATHQIDRFPDNDGNYTPDNCRWATRSENAKGRRHWGTAA